MFQTSCGTRPPSASASLAMMSATGAYQPRTSSRKRVKKALSYSSMSASAIASAGGGGGGGAPHRKRTLGRSHVTFLRM